MALKFGNPIVAGTILVIPAIQAPGYLPGSAGWIIKQDGSAEFNNLTLRGSYIGTDYTFDTDGAFWFDPVTGHLIAGISAGSGTAFGEPYVAGIGAYYTSPGGVIYAVNMHADGGSVPINFLFNSGAGWQTSAQIDSINATGLSLDSSFSGDMTLNAGTHNIVLDSNVQATGAITAQSGTPAVPTLITTDFWQTITLDVAWTAGAQAPQYRLLPDGNVQVRGTATIAGTAAAANINSGHPIPAAYRPGANRIYRPPTAADAAGTAQIASSGVFTMRASGFTATQVILDGMYSI
jgi:hypothetical protein